MSCFVFFDFSQGLAKTMRAPKGTLQAMVDHVAKVERVLHTKVTQYLDNPSHWGGHDFAKVDDEVLCQLAEDHWCAEHEAEHPPAQQRHHHQPPA